MFIKLGKIVIALIMLFTSLSTWRYQGDIHHLHTKFFKSQQNHSEDQYQKLWKVYAQKGEKMEMREIHPSEFFTRLFTPPSPHPSEFIMERMISDKSWNHYIPNSHSSTYPLSQKIWMSQNLKIQDLMNYLLDHNLSEASPPPSASHSNPNQ